MFVLIHSVYRKSFSTCLNICILSGASRNSVFMFNLLNFFNFADSRVSELGDKLKIIGRRQAELKTMLETREQFSREFNQRAIVKAKRIDHAKEVLT